MKNTLKDTTDIVRSGTAVKPPLSSRHLSDAATASAVGTLKRPLFDTCLARELLTMFEGLIPKALDIDEEPDEIDFNVQSEEGSIWQRMFEARQQQDGSSKTAKKPVPESANLERAAGRRH
jgi:hypothetical protein